MPEKNLDQFGQHLTLLNVGVVQYAAVGIVFYREKFQFCDFVPEPLQDFKNALYVLESLFIVDLIVLFDKTGQ